MGHLDNDDILCVTFTRQAARSMRNRIRQRLTRRLEDLPPISTLHSFCTTALREENLLGECLILDNSDSLLRDCAKVVDVPVRAKKTDDEGTVTLSTIQLYALFRNAGLEIPDHILMRDKKRKEKAQKQAETHRKKKDAGEENAEGVIPDTPPLEGKTREEFLLEKIFLYEEFKQSRTSRERDCIDYNDILLRMRDAVSKGTYTHRFKQILVDEVQDLNDVQMQLIQSLVAEDGHIEYFGDPQQAIYSFMGSRSEMLSTLSKNCTVSSKNVNYRSSSYLVNFYNEYVRFRNLPLTGLTKLMGGWEQKPKSKTHTTGEDSLMFLYGRSDTHELNAVCKILRGLPKRETNAILVRSTFVRDDVISRLATMNRFLVIDPSDDYHTEFLRYMDAHLKACRHAENPQSWDGVLRYFCMVPSRDIASQIIDTSRKYGVTPLDLTLMEEGSTLSLFAEMMTCGDVCLAFFHNGKGEADPSAFYLEDISSGERHAYPTDEKSVTAALRGRMDEDVLIILDDDIHFDNRETIDENREKRRRLDAIVDSFNSGERCILKTRDLEKILRDCDLSLSGMTMDLPEEDDKTEGMDNLRKRAEHYCEILSGAAEEDGTDSPAPSFLERQEAFLTREGMKAIRDVLYIRYRPLFLHSMPRFRELAGDSSYWKPLDWLSILLAQMEEQKFIPEDKFHFWYAAKEEIQGELRDLELLRQEIILDGLQRNGLFLDAEESLAGLKKKKRLDALLALKMEQYRERFPEIFDKPQKVLKERLDELGAILSELTTTELISRMDLPITPVIVTTIHQSKGLEYDNVFLYNSVDEQYTPPSKLPPQLRHLAQQEEDRIFYVGMTRAKKRLVVSYSDAPGRRKNFIRPLKHMASANKRKNNSLESVFEEIINNIASKHTILESENMNNDLSKIKSITGRLDETIPHVSNRPQFKGTILIDGVEFHMAAWLNHKADGTLSISLERLKKNAGDH